MHTAIVPDMIGATPPRPRPDFLMRPTSRPAVVSHLGRLPSAAPSSLTPPFFTERAPAFATRPRRRTGCAPLRKRAGSSPRWPAKVTDLDQSEGDR